MIPKIDSDLGIVYCTSFSGCGGRIKAKNEDFVVSEVLSKKSLSKFEDSGYAVYKLKKNNIDTHHALSKILKKHGLQLKALGLKDASAITEQYVCTTNKCSPPVNISEDNA